jgi:tetratricopeptide (TPR) repeat protein
LRTRALWRNPFVHQGLILFLYDKLPGRFRDNAITRAWIALGQAELDLALRRFGALIDRDPERYGYLRFVRASAFANTNQQDSATAELTALLAQLRAVDSTELVNYYESKELLEHALGLLHLHARRVPLAQEAFGRAVAENAAFAPSHAMLGLMALAARDAATAEAEYGLAVSMDPGDVEHLIGQGRASRSARRLSDAVEQFKKAISIAPLYAVPHYLLASALEASGDAPGAVASYKQFLALAARTDPQRGDAERKIRTLGGSP